MDAEGAHVVLGVALVAILLVWGHQVIRAPSLKTSSRVAGAATVGAGTYLVLYAAAAAAAASSSSTWKKKQNLVEAQHAAMGLSLVAAGASEMLRCLRLWLLNISNVALIFLGHPQRSAENAAKHVALGLSLLVGAALLYEEKRAKFPPLSWDAPLAALAVFVAALILFSYREEVGYVDEEDDLLLAQPGVYIALWAACAAAGTAPILLLERFG